MRTMLTVQLPVETGNAAIKDGRIAKVIQATTERIKPESAYFFTRDGRRTMQFVFDMASSADIPVVGEPFFMELDAAVEFTPVMNPAELQQGLSKI